VPKKMNPNSMLRICILTFSISTKVIKAPIGSSYGKNLMVSNHESIESVQGKLDIPVFSLFEQELIG
jgi:hypothetical protein